MSGYYCYKGKMPLGKEPLGTFGRHIWRHLKTVKGVVRRANGLYPDKEYSLYFFTSFYDDATFRKIK